MTTKKAVLSKVSVFLIVVLLLLAGAGREVCAFGDEIIKAAPPDDQQERLARFENRNSAESLEKLAHKLASLIDINTPGVREGFGKFYNEKKYKEAITAYKDYFLDKLRNPVHYGIPAECISPRKMATSGFGIPESISTDELMRNVVSINMPQHMLDNDAFKTLYKGRQFFDLKIDIGKPGAINWTFTPEQCKPKKEDSGRITQSDNTAIEVPVVPNIKAWQPGYAFFAKYMRRVEVFNKLLAEYAKTKDKALLRQVG